MLVCLASPEVRSELLARAEREPGGDECARTERQSEHLMRERAGWVCQPRSSSAMRKARSIDWRAFRRGSHVVV